MSTHYHSARRPQGADAVGAPALGRVTDNAGDSVAGVRLGGPLPSDADYYPALSASFPSGVAAGTYTLRLKWPGLTAQQTWFSVVI